MKATLQQEIVPSQASASPLTVANILAPIHDVAQGSPSLIASRHSVKIGDTSHDISKFLLLGQRGGGQPIRVALFAGLDAGALETTVALTRLLLQFELAPSLARDFALFGYPSVNVQGENNSGNSLQEFEARFAENSPDQDVQFFKSELQTWSFDGLISLRVDSEASGFYATARSKIIAQDVVAPAIAVISSKFPLETDPLRLRPTDRHSRTLDHAQGKLTTPLGSRPYPFEIEVFAPDALPIEQRVTGLFLSVQEILRGYRQVISHAQNI